MTGAGIGPASSAATRTRNRPLAFSGPSGSNRTAAPSFASDAVAASDAVDTASSRPPGSTEAPSAPGSSVAPVMVTAWIGDSRKRSSEGTLMIDDAGPGGAVHAGPRTRTAGTRSAFPMARPEAAAISSAKATMVASSTRPDPSSVPRRSTSAGRPAHPMATLTTPSRHGRPKVSVITTASHTPKASRRVSLNREAVSSGSSGSSVSSPLPTFDASTPALAHTKPWRVSAITRSPRRATTRRVSRSTQASLPSGSSGTTRPSALDTIFWVTTTMSPSSGRMSFDRMASTRRRPRSSPGRTSGIPVMGRIETVIRRGPRGRRPGRCGQAVRWRRRRP